MEEIIKYMKLIKQEMEKNSKTQKEKLKNPQDPQLTPAQVEAKQQTQKVKEQIHKIHEHLKIQLGLVQKIEQLRQDLIPLERKQGEKLHNNLKKKAKKLKEQATSIQSKCRKVHNKFEKAVEIEKQAEDIKIDDIKDTTLGKDAEQKDMIQMIKARLAQEIQHIQDEVTEVDKKLWDEYYMKLACLAALRSKDPSTPVS